MGFLFNCFVQSSHGQSIVGQDGWEKKKFGCGFEGCSKRFCHAKDLYRHQRQKHGGSVLLPRRRRPSYHYPITLADSRLSVTDKYSQEQDFYDQDSQNTYSNDILCKMGTCICEDHSSETIYSHDILCKVDTCSNNYEDISDNPFGGMAVEKK